MASSEVQTGDSPQQLNEGNIPILYRRANRPSWPPGARYPRRSNHKSQQKLSHFGTFSELVMRRKSVMKRSQHGVGDEADDEGDEGDEELRLMNRV